MAGERVAGPRKKWPTRKNTEYFTPARFWRKIVSMAKARLRIPSRAVALLIIAFFLVDRAASIGVFLPWFCVEDERWVREGAMKMVREATIDPGTHKYPQLMFTLTAGVYGAAYIAANIKAIPHFESLESFSFHRANYPFPFVETIILGRLLSAVLGAAALWVFYLIARREFDRYTALLALLFAAACPSMLFSTQMLKNDSLLALGVMLTVLFSLRVRDRGRLTDYALAGAAAGLCLASKYHAVAMVPVLAAHGLGRSDTGFLRSFVRRPRWLVVIPASLAAFALLSPWTWLDLQGAVEQGAVEWALQNTLNPLLRRSSEHWWQLPILFQFSSALPLALGIPLCGLSLGGLFFKIDSSDRGRLVIWSYPAGFLAYMIVFSELGVPHLYTPVAPFFCLLAALVLSAWLGSEGRIKRGTAVAAAGAVCLYNLFLFHSFTSLEQWVLVGPALEMQDTHRPGDKDVALIPYYPNPELDWRISFAPQFFLAPKVLAGADPDRLLIHYTYYNAYLDNPELLDNPGVREMVLLFMELRSGQAGFVETDRWVGNIFTGTWYATLIPDLKGLRSGIFKREMSARPPPPIDRVNPGW